MAMSSHHPLRIAVAGALLLASTGWASAQTQSAAQNAAQNAPRSIDDNAGVFIDGKTFQITPGKPAADAAGRITSLNARPLGPGAIIFRSGDKLYIVDAPPANGTGAVAAPAPAPEPASWIKVEYVPPKNPEHQKVFDLVKERRALETFRDIFGVINSPYELTVKTVGCDGVSNAWYQREGKRPTVSICYEYLQELMQSMPKETTPAGITPQDAIVGQLMFAVAHEMGHAMYDIFDVPIFGRQEDAADQFATYVMLQFGGERALRLVKGAAYSYRDFIKGYKEKPKVTLPLAVFSSDHGLPEERFYNLACIAYGYDPKVFAEFVEKEYLPQSRAKKCDFEYSDIKYAFQQVIGPHLDRQKVREMLDRKWMPEARSQAPK